MLPVLKARGRDCRGLAGAASDRGIDSHWPGGCPLCPVSLRGRQHGRLRLRATPQPGEAGQSGQHPRRDRWCRLRPARRAAAGSRTTSPAASPPEAIDKELRSATDHRFPVLGKHSLGGEDARFGARRPGHRHQGQDITADDGTPVVAPRGGTITWRAFQRKGAGYYLVLQAVDEAYNYVFMHLQKGSLQARVGDRVRTGQVLGGRRQHRLVVRAAPPLRDLARALVQGRRADRPASVPRRLGRSFLSAAPRWAKPLH